MSAFIDYGYFGNCNQKTESSHTAKYNVRRLNDIDLATILGYLEQNDKLDEKTLGFFLYTNGKLIYLSRISTLDTVLVYILQDINTTRIKNM